MTVLDHTQLRPFHENDLAALVAFWNKAFADRRNFAPLTAHEFKNRVLRCEVFDPNGLILAWHTGQDGVTALVGLAHALRPAPPRGLYLRATRRHHLALLYVDPAYRRQGTGSRLLRAAENWLYYCPVFVGGGGAPCYGTLEGPRPPFFGATQRLGISVHDSTLINFLAKRGYHVADAGEVSMRLALKPQPEPTPPDLARWGLRLESISHERPFRGREPEGRQEYTLYGDNCCAEHGGEHERAPYCGHLLVDAGNLLHAAISWYPMRQAGSAAIAGFWVSPSLRGYGLGRYLLDRALYDMAQAPQPWGGYQQVEVQTHLTRHARAAALYERRGFVLDAAWVNTSKECAVRGVGATGMSGS